MANPIARRIVRIGRRRGVPRKYILAALATGRVESNFRNLPGGDADSQGWRQERASLYRNPRNVNASINRFFNEAKQHDRGQSAGELAADVQRPAAQYRGRYKQVLHTGEPQRILRSGGGAVGTYARAGGGGRYVSGFRPASVSLRNQTVFDEAGFETAQRRAQVAAFLQKAGRGNSVLFRSGLLSTEAPDPTEYTSERLVSHLKQAGPLRFKNFEQAQQQGGRYAKGTVRVPQGGGEGLMELFYDPIGGWDKPRGAKGKPHSIGAIGDHEDHVHVGGDPRVMLQLGRVARQMGLTLRENPLWDPVDPVHTKGSLHYSSKKIRTRKGRKQVGMAIDISGNPQLMAAFTRRVMRAYGLS